VAELVTFVLLDFVYPAVVEVEPETGTGSRTDFAIRAAVRTHFEVYRKAPPKPLRAAAQCLAEIGDELEKVESPDFWLAVVPQSGPKVPSMRKVREKVERWLETLDYDEQIRLRDQERRARRDRAAVEMPGVDASPTERARHLAAHPLFEPPTFRASGDDWSVRITAHPREPDARAPGRFTVGLRSAGEVHIENSEGLEAAVRNKLKQHAGLAEPLVLVLDLSSPIIDDREIAAMLFGPVITTMLDPVTVIASERDRKKGIWPDPVKLPPRPAAVLILRGIWLDCREVTADLWLPPGVTSPILPGPWAIRTLGPDGRLGIETASLAIPDALR
jgi:hypothetical protein